MTMKGISKSQLSIMSSASDAEGSNACVYHHDSVATSTHSLNIMLFGYMLKITSEYTCILKRKVAKYYHEIVWPGPLSPCHGVAER